LLAPSDEMQLPSLTRLPADLRVGEYQPSDLDACLAIYRSNVAEFLPDSIELFEAHLSEPFSYFLVAESLTAVLACGGLDIRADANSAGLTFGMVRRDSHRCGLGSLLTLTRLALLDGEHDPAFVGLETTLAIEPFYQRFGFERLSYPEQRYSGGSSYISMGLSLSMQQRDSFREYLATLPVTFDIEFPNDRAGPGDVLDAVLVRTQLVALKALIDAQAAQIAALQAAIAGTASNIPGIGTLSMGVSDPPSQGEVQTIADKVDEMINGLIRT